jgi:3-hydroxyisobutyrate dehydrogenase-like beta-hydroxyacid dehydrogenase
MPTVAVIAPGAMGSAVGRRLAENGARVLTFLEGRSEQSIARAHAAAMASASLAEIAKADLVLSILPPADAVGFAQTLAPALRMSKAKPAYIDCNAINPDTMQKVVAVLANTGCEVIDASIIGGPPVKGQESPAFYVSGDPRHRAEALSALGLRIRPIDGPVGAASALKMVYAGIGKGMTALQTAMLLAAERAGCADSLCQELSESTPQVLERMRRMIPDMYPKAYRWVAEMEEIAAFLGPDDPAAQIFKANAEIYRAMAQDRQGERKRAAILDRILGRKRTAPKSWLGSILAR